MSNYGVYISLLNDEKLIGPCYLAAKKVFPNVTVLNLGSTDKSFEILKSLGAEFTIISYRPGDITAENYAEFKNSYGAKHDKIFWIDADEVYPEASLLKVKEFLESDQGEAINQFLYAFWLNLKDGPEGLSVSSPVNKGRVAWNTKCFKVCRTWPYERLRAVQTKFEKEPRYAVADPSIICYHGVLLNRSTERKSEAKQSSRAALFSKLCTWTKLDKLPW